MKVVLEMSDHIFNLFGDRRSPAGVEVDLSEIVAAQIYRWIAEPRCCEDWRVA